MKRFYILIIVFGVVFSKRAIAQNSSFYFITSDSVHLYVHTAGNGDPCLFIHGGPGITSYIFEAVPAAKLIEQKVRMIYFDQRGCGRSSSPSDSDYSMKRMEKDIEELRTFLRINKWSVMAHSFGGIIMTAYARDYPNSIRSLIYVHCTLNILSALQSHISNGTKLLKEDGDNYTVDTTVSPFDQMMAVHQELAKRGIEYKIMFRSQREKNIEDSLIDAASDHFNWDFQHHVWKIQDYMIDYTPYTKAILCPVLIITGTKDYAVGPRSYKLWKFKNSRVVLYNGAHTSYQEEPEWFAEKVVAFLKN